MAAPEHLSNLRPPEVPAHFVENGVPAGEALANQDPPALPRQSWQGKLLAVSFAIFAFEIGLCLVTFPWIDKTWDISYLDAAPQFVRDLWGNTYFRGAITGLGLVNIYIAVAEVGRLLRRSSVR
jgi:hypothetical protein